MSKFSKFVHRGAETSPWPALVTAEVRATDLDPRPDLAVDHWDWAAVLALAWHRNRELWGLLHGLRCGGARMSRRRAKDGREMYKLDYEPLLDVWDEKELRETWLMPHKDELGGLFELAPAFVTLVQREITQMAG